MSIHIGLRFTCDRENVLIGLWRPKASFRPKGPSLDWSRENGWASNKRYRIINLFYPRERHTVYYFQPMWKYRNVEEYTAGYKSVLSLGVQLHPSKKLEILASNVSFFSTGPIRKVKFYAFIKLEK